ncbi:MAG TPA: hypothetical protein PLJ13_17080 [Cyclobacteriaceae bacterium]|nr:hypothetical protein [Cyclobacteriaceae bacterium]
MKKTIKYFVSGIITVSVLTFAACSKDEALPQIDGYNNSNEVAASNLVAHWTFDENNNETLSGTAPTKTVGTVGSTAGKLGNALQLTQGGIVYPAITKINTVDALNNFTVSLWVNIRGQKGLVGGGYTSLFGIIPTATDFWGNIQATVETARHLPGSDTVEFKNYLNTTMSDGSQRGEDNVALFNNDAATADGNGQTGAYFKGGKDWALYTMTWEGSTGLFKLYANGVSVGGYTKRGTTAGVLKMRVPALAVFGSMASSDLGFASATRPDWAPLATASIDDVRVFNTALSQTEVTALFNLGTAGR